MGAACVERELLMTGIGGQGVQLAAQLLAKAATHSGRYAQLFGSYGGMMRGGNTDATLIIGDQPVQAPPMVSSAWSALLMHYEFAEPAARRLQPGGIVIINRSILLDTAVATLMTPEAAGQVTVLGLPATELAIGLGAAAAATMVALGAYARATDIVGIATLIATLPDVLPSYRRQHVESNTQALLAGARAAEASGVALAAWPEPAAVGA